MSVRFLSIKRLLLQALALSALIMLTGCTSRKMGTHESAYDSIYAPIIDDPKLPSVLLVGDSISEGYTVQVRRLLAGKANVHRIPENGRYTSYGLQHIKTWLGDGRWTVIHFNWGIWDTHHFGPNNELVTKGGRIRTPLREYEANLQKLIDTMKGTGARLIWASTTPVAEGLSTRPECIVQYNAAAAKIMKSHQIRIVDLYAEVMPRPDKLQVDGCHFNSRGRKILAKKVAEAILAELKQTKNKGNVYKGN